jgi:hypothetical protein
LAELLVALLSPIATYVGKKIIEKIKKRSELKEIQIDVNSPDYNGTANHWVTNLFERISEGKDRELQYAYIGNNLETSIEKDKDVATLKMHVPNVDKDAMNELMNNQQWATLNDPIHGNGVFNFAIPQITIATLGDDKLQVKYKDLSSVPLNGKYMITTKLQILDYEKRDLGDFYKKGGTFEIPVYLEQPTVEYEVYPVTPPAPTIPDYAIQTKILKDRTQSKEFNNPLFVYCPYCGSKMSRSSKLKFCVVCGKDIEKHINF